jgi:hypothetical protein
MTSSSRALSPHHSTKPDRPYVLGLPVLRRPTSTIIHGIEDDVRDIIAHLEGHLGQDVRSAAG